MNQDYVERICPVCGKSYTASIGRLRHGRQTTCSRDCSYLRRAGLLDKKVRYTCSRCGADFERSPSQIKNKHGGIFCSPACHYAGRGIGLSRRIVTKPYVISSAALAGWRDGAKKTAAIRRRKGNYGHSDKTRAKLSEATALSLAKRQPFAPSKLEGRVSLYIREWGIPFVPQYPFRGKGGRWSCVVDFWFPTMFTVIEVNGTYWHSDPRVYSVLNGTQTRNLAIYTRKVEYLKRLGVRVVEVWELDLERDIAQAMSEAYTRLLAS